MISISAQRNFCASKQSLIDSAKNIILQEASKSQKVSHHFNRLEAGIRAKEIIEKEWKKLEKNLEESTRGDYTLQAMKASALSDLKPSFFSDRQLKGIVIKILMFNQGIEPQLK